MLCRDCASKLPHPHRFSRVPRLRMPRWEYLSVLSCSTCGTAVQPRLLTDAVDEKLSQLDQFGLGGRRPPLLAPVSPFQSQPSQ